jgi:hypothetical protein
MRGDSRVPRSGEGGHHVRSRRLAGLASSLRAQKKDAEAAAVEQRLAAAWTGADVKLAGSRY